LILKTNIGTKLSHFDTWHNREVTRVKKKKYPKKIKNSKNSKNIKKIQKNHKLTRGIDFNTVWSKLTVRTKLSHF